MTKTFLLSAVAVGVMTFAGAASAGSLTAGSQIGGTSIATATKVSPYTLAKDFALASAGLKTNNAADLPANLGRTSFNFENTTNPIPISGSTDYVVTLTLTGSVKFIDQGQTTVSLGNGVVTTATPILSADGKTLTVYAKTAAGAAGTLNKVVVNGFNLHVTAQDTVSVAYKLQQVVGAQTLDLDSSTAQQVITFKNALTLYDGDTRSVLAALPSFLAFNTGAGALTSNTFASSVEAYKTDLAGAGVPAVGSIITGYAATVTGPQVKDILTSFSGQAIANATDVTATSAVFTATANASSVNLVLTPKAATPISEGSYKAAIRPTYATGWAGAASVDRTFVNVGLAGTNFYAPWFGLGGTAASSTLRIANNGAAATGAIVVQLRARNAGSTATTTSVTFPAVAANSFRSITGAELREAFGTDAANGDLLVSIQSDAYGVVSAKVRTTQLTGQVLENSLDVLRAPSATSDQANTLITTTNAIKVKTDTIGAAPGA